MPSDVADSSYTGLEAYMQMSGSDVYCCQM
jgi:hypothetical protein